MTSVQFITRQCSNPHCRFRFPLSINQPVGQYCPKCGYKLEQIGHPYSNTPANYHPSLENRGELFILLDNVRSALNVGSIIRTSEGIGVKHIYLCGITPTPDNPKVKKTALSAEISQSWSYHLNAMDVLNEIKRKRIQVWALEITPNSTPLLGTLRQKNSHPILLVAGNEQSGVDPELLSMSDQVIYLPMSGKKTSLNIAVAVGVAATLIKTS
jgi:23S rRNA (guanosine2251-2'-O)-methyltransferase